MKEAINPQHRGKSLTCASGEAARLLCLLLPCRAGDAHPAACWMPVFFSFFTPSSNIHQVVIVVPSACGAFRGNTAIKERGLLKGRVAGCICSPGWLNSTWRHRSESESRQIRFLPSPFPYSPEPLRESHSSGYASQICNRCWCEARRPWTSARRMRCSFTPLVFCGTRSATLCCACPKGC